MKETICAHSNTKTDGKYCSRRARTNRGQEVMSEQEGVSHTVKQRHGPTCKDEGLL